MPEPRWNWQAVPVWHWRRWHVIATVPFCRQMPLSIHVLMVIGAVVIALAPSTRRGARKAVDDCC